MDYKRLKLKIKEVYDTQEAFAEAMGMSKTALNQRLNNVVEWKSPEIAKACGFSGPSYYSELFRKVAHQTPTEYKIEKDILKTLIELLETQEQIKIEYEIKERSEVNDK